MLIHLLELPLMITFCIAGNRLVTTSSCCEHARLARVRKQHGYYTNPSSAHRSSFSRLRL
jgi:hypothetical protein